MSEENCLFCRIAKGEIASRKVYEDADIFAFEDIHPQAPVHILIIPKVHVPSLAEVLAAKAEWAGRLIQTAARIAVEKKLASGYRLVINCGPDAGQEVYHIHVHLLGGRRLGWPPG